MNKPIIESIEWHKSQLFKLLEDDDLYKEEGDIYSVKTELNEIIEKVKAKKRVWVKPTSRKKGYYREQEVGRKDVEVGREANGGSKAFNDSFKSVDVLREAQIHLQDKQYKMVAEIESETEKNIKKAKDIQVWSAADATVRYNAIEKATSEGKKKMDALKVEKAALSKERGVAEKKFVAKAFKTGDFGKFNSLSGKLVDYHGSTYRVGEIDKGTGVIRLYNRANVNEHNMSLYDFNLFINPASSAGSKEFESKKKIEAKGFK